MWWNHAPLCWNMWCNQHKSGSVACKIISEGRHKQVCPCMLPTKAKPLHSSRLAWTAKLWLPLVYLLKPWWMRNSDNSRGPCRSHTLRLPCSLEAADFRRTVCWSWSSVVQWVCAGQRKFLSWAVQCLFQSVFLKDAVALMKLLCFLYSGESTRDW